MLQYQQQITTGFSVIFYAHIQRHQWPNLKKYLKKNPEFIVSFS